MNNKPVSESELKAMVAREIAAARDHDDGALKTRRADAIAYYRGEMKDVPAEDGRSSIVSRDVADTIGWMLPGIVRTFTASDQMVRFVPVAPGDEAFAGQASAGGNHVFWKDNDGYRVLFEATHDSLLLGNGIVKIWWDETPATKISSHSGLSDDQLTALLDGEGVEVLAHSRSEEEGEPEIDPATGLALPGEMVARHEVKIARREDSGRIRLAAIAPEDFGIDGDARSMEEARFAFHRKPTTRSDLVEMGFAQGKIDTLTPAGNDDTPEALARDDNASAATGDDSDRSMQTVDLYECYLRVDIDGDGVAETVRIHYAGSDGGGAVLDWEVWEDELPFVDIPCAPMPHRWDAESIADATMDVQKVKTVLTRQALDNIYDINLPQREIEEGSILNPDELFSPKFGGVLWRRSGSQPVGTLAKPFVANHAFQAIAYQDQIIEKRTGVSRATMALDPEALQNQTATAVQNTRDAAYSQIELIARNQAELGWKKVFRIILALMVRHQDRARTIRLNDQWTEIDPRHWNAGMDVSVNIGLGTGSRDRDMAMLNAVLQSQMMMSDRMAAAGLLPQALEMLPMIRATLVKIAESAGLKSPEQFYPDVGPDKLQAMQQQLMQMQAQGDPKAAAEAQKMQGQLQMDQARLQQDMQRDRMKMQAEQERRAGEMVLKREQLAAEMALKREQLAAELQLKRELAEAELALRAEMDFAGVAPDEAGGTSQVQLGGEPG